MRSYEVAKSSGWERAEEIISEFYFRQFAQDVQAPIFIILCVMGKVA